ncbi:VOC family protein [Mucilaginibacter lacusdianchii]|uniref:VOC family protein n=1 Tax=Mucilaginibacter lacusdianchii TaxID=2684211 RepID=UPI00131A64A0|nr:VOC family protein [Mucilaginibacter sp. JXJ CY 39]
MNLTSIRIITNDVKKLVNFYEQLTGITAIQYTEDFAELNAPSATLAIGSTRTLQLFGGDEVAKAAQNKTAIIEFIVKDVDADYDRLVQLFNDRIVIVQQPTVMPWGNKSLLLRDPDGNLINLFTPVTVEAIRKFEGTNR